MSRTELWLDERCQRRADPGSRASGEEGFDEMIRREAQARSLKRRRSMTSEYCNRNTAIEREPNKKEASQMRISIGLVAVVVVAGLFLAAMPVMAHHAFAAAFDENKPLNLQGKITKVELVNPHAWLWMDVTGADGKVVNWGIEGGPPTNLFRN